MRKMTQVETVKRHLEKFGQINSLEAIRRYGITRISAVIYTIRNSGIPISAVEDIPTAPQFVTYRVDHEALRAAKAEALVLEADGLSVDYDDGVIEFPEYAKRITDVAIRANRLVNS